MGGFGGTKVKGAWFSYTMSKIKEIIFKVIAYPQTSHAQNHWAYLVYQLNIVAHNGPGR